jgi:hypothetical protein
VKLFKAIGAISSADAGKAIKAKHIAKIGRIEISPDRFITTETWTGCD